MQKMDASLRKLAGLPILKETQLLPGHGDFSTLGEELANNFYIAAPCAAGMRTFKDKEKKNMKIYITGLPSGYEVEHLVRLFTHAPLTLTPPEEARTVSGPRKKRIVCTPWCGSRARAGMRRLHCPAPWKQAARRWSSPLPA